MKSGIHEIFIGKDNLYYFRLKAPNNKIILQSEGYQTKQGTINGINSCKVNSSIANRYNRLTSKNNQYYFTLKASNGEIIGRSETYTTTQAREKGIEACMAYGPTATIKDKTASNQFV